MIKETIMSVAVAPKIPNWECYHCGLLNYDKDWRCKACQAECEYGYDDNHDVNNKQQYSTLDILTLLAKNSITYQSKCTIMVNELPEEMVNEELGSKQLFGIFGDVKKIEIIRQNDLQKKEQKNANAEITFYSNDSVTELRKLSSAYYNYKIFC